MEPLHIITLDDNDRHAAVGAILGLESYTWEKLLDTAVAAINHDRARRYGESE
jgi:hypothetical protein